MSQDTNILLTEVYDRHNLEGIKGSYVKIVSYKLDKDKATVILAINNGSEITTETHEVNIKKT